MKLFQIAIFSVLLICTAFTGGNESDTIVITCVEDGCGCDAYYGKIGGTYVNSGKIMNEYPVYTGPGKKKDYILRLQAESPKGANFTVYRWEIRTATGDELVYFNNDVKIDPFALAETEKGWVPDNSDLSPAPLRVIAQ